MTKITNVEHTPPSFQELPPLREVIAKHQLNARKGLGQNFLFDLNLTRKIARSAGPLENATVFEVGPGPGGLTRALLLEGARHVVTIEKDPRIKDILLEISKAYPGRLTSIEGDALTIDWQALIGAFPPPYKIVSNLPYYIATPLLLSWLGQEPWPPFWECLVLMFQKEVADRLIASHKTSSYGRLSIISQWRTHPEKVFDLPARAFIPSPKVASTVVKITPRKHGVYPLALFKKLEKLTQSAFSQRRKMIRSSLKGIWQDPSPVLESFGLSPTLRAEELSVATFAALAEKIEGES